MISSGIMVMTDAHVHIIGWWHGGTQVKIFEVTHHALGARGGDDAVEEEFGSDDIGCFGANITSIFDTITTNSPMDAIWDQFFGAMCTNNAEVSGTFTRGEVGDQDEKHGVCARNGG